MEEPVRNNHRSYISTETMSSNTHIRIQYKSALKQDRAYDTLLKVITCSCNTLICSLISSNLISVISFSSITILDTVCNSSSVETAFYVTHLNVFSLF